MKLTGVARYMNHRILASSIFIVTSTIAISISFAAENDPGSKPSDPKSQLTPEMRGDILMARKEYRDAIEVYQLGPKNSAILLNKTGIAYHQLTDTNTARKYYEKAVKVNPEYSEAVNNLGTAFYAHKNYRKAITQYLKALQLNPNSASVYSNLGTAFFARKKYDQALQAYQKALQLDPEVFEHRSSGGVLLQERTVTERAKFHYYLAKTYAKAGEHTRALSYMRKALEEGFKEKSKFMEDPEFAQMRELPEFQQLMTMETRVL